MAGSGGAASQPLEHLADLPGEVWTNFVLPKCGASELIRMKRVTRASRGIVDHALERSATMRNVISKERDRRAASRHTFRQQRQARASFFNRNPPIVKAALDGDLAAVVAELDVGVAVDACGTWEEVEEKMCYDKSWTWNMDSALSMACAIGHLPLARLLLDRGANPQHRVCVTADVHYSPASIARKQGHITCADYMDQIIDKIEAPRRAAALQRAREHSIKIRAEACRMRQAGPPYIPTPPEHHDSAGGVHPQYFASAAKDFKYGLGYEEYGTYIPGRFNYMSDDEIAARRGRGDLRDPSGEQVSQKESVSFAILSLEVLKTQPQFLPSRYGGGHGVVGEMLELLRAIPERAPQHATACAAIEAWEVHATEAAEQLRIRVERMQAEEALRRQAKEQAKEQRRNAEVARCRRIWPNGGWAGYCTNNKCGYTQHEMDQCTWGHSEHDLPPHCRWLGEGGCRNGDRCRFNHMPYE